MPRRPARPCPRRDCPGLVRNNSCSRCGPLYRPPTADDRPSPQARGYDARWRAIRKIILSREPLCRGCAGRGRTTAATLVDHIQPLADGGTHDINNLQPLCRYCHQLKTRDDLRRRG